MRAGIGIDIGGTKILGLVLTEDGRVEREIVLKTAAGQGYEALLGRLKELIHSLIEQSSYEISSIGIALAGAIEQGRHVPFCPNLPLKNVELAKIIEEEFHIPCVLSNDVNAALYAESALGREAAAEAELGLFIGTGVGGAIMIGGKLYSGRGGAGEFGHIRIVEDGKLCGCGKKGCLEAYASKTAIQNYIKEELSKGRSSLLSEGFECEEDGGMLKKGALLRAFQEGDTLAIEALEQSRRALGLALVNLVNIFHPSAIVLGGGIMEDFFDYYKPHLKEYIEGEAYTGFADGLIIRRAELGDRGAALGATLIAREGLKHE